jgi:cullin 1
MYSLLSRIQDGLEPLRSKFEEHVKASGLNAVSKVIPEGGIDALVRVAFVFGRKNRSKI